MSSIPDRHPTLVLIHWSVKLGRLVQDDTLRVAQTQRTRCANSSAGSVILSGMTILVTGGAGYIGSHTVRVLRERGREVVVLDSMESGHRAAIGDVPLVESDISDHEVVAKVVSDYDVDSVFHFAGLQGGGRVHGESRTVLSQQRRPRVPR